MPGIDNGYEVAARTPGFTDYNRVRSGAGLSAKPVEAVERALANTIYGVRVERAGEVVGFGRVVGDSGLYYEVVDVAVLPEHQGNGLGAAIMDSLMGYLRQNAAPGAFVGLHAGRDSPGCTSGTGSRCGRRSRRGCRRCCSAGPLTGLLQERSAREIGSQRAELAAGADRAGG